mmetsp:Transcript_7091/g.14209  ORF Transcript_7091/g.14209 Transcript_7091/m.14209 type:complete len:178 (-) Transcript_7091:183-716(-)
MTDEEEFQKSFIVMKKAMDAIRSPEKFMELYNKDEFALTSKVKPYKCQYGSGYTGGFYDVAKHERNIAASQQPKVPPVLRQAMPTVVRQYVVPGANAFPQQVMSETVPNVNTQTQNQYISSGFGAVQVAPFNSAPTRYVQGPGQASAQLSAGDGGLPGAVNSTVTAIPVANNASQIN